MLLTMLCQKRLGFLEQFRQLLYFRMHARPLTFEISGRQRWVSLASLNGKIVVLVWTDRNDGPRLISCREAEKYEKQAYFYAFPQN
jgi:uncharacterized DUF497 family protein